MPRYEYLQAVSYTHLDVYKRQGRDHHRLRRLPYLQGNVDGGSTPNRDCNAFLNGFFEAWRGHGDLVGADLQLGIEEAAVGVGSHRVGGVSVGVGYNDGSAGNYSCLLYTSRCV